MPIKRHMSWSTALDEAKALNAHHPETTFVVMREIGCVKQVEIDKQEQAR